MTPRYQLPLLLYDSTARQMERLIARMALDDALVRQGWRLERCYLNTGREHYRLYKVEGRVMTLVGVADVTIPARLAYVQHQLGMYLAGIGFTVRNSRLIIYGSRTDLAASKYKVGQLFRLQTSA